MKMRKCAMNKGEGCLLESIDYTKWQQERTDNVRSDEFQEATVAYTKENPLSKKVQPVYYNIISKVVITPHNTLYNAKSVVGNFCVRGYLVCVLSNFMGFCKN